MRKNLCAITLITSVLLPVCTHADTVAELQAQVAALLAQVSQLQQSASAGGGTTTTTSSSVCPQLSRSLKLGMTGQDVSDLQLFLAQDPSVYPEAIVSGYYGALTQAAVQRWQAKNGIISSGTPATTGYGVVGPRTIAAIRQQCASGGGSVGVAPVGGFIQISPVSGNAPLGVSIQATINTVNSCAAATYVLDYGDGSPLQQIALPANACAPTTHTLNHTYTYGGVYLITLSAAGHSTTASVSVYGPSAPIGTNNNNTTTNNSTPTSTPVSTMPAETFTASVTSGSAPLQVTFSGKVTSEDPAWCASGCSLTLDFGDGSNVLIPLPTAQNSWQSYSVSHTYPTGTFTAVLNQGGLNAASKVGSLVINSGDGTAYSYDAIKLTTKAGGNNLAVSVQFDTPSICDPYQLSWGDGSALVTHSAPAGASNCATGVQTVNATHTYAAGGSYTVTLLRGVGLKKQDTASVVISN